jgi:hypothetical protein
MQYAIATVATTPAEGEASSGTPVVFTNIAPFVKGLSDEQASVITQIVVAYLKHHTIPIQDLGPLVRKIREALSS